MTEHKLSPKDKANEILNKCLEICSPTKFWDYNSIQHLRKSKQVALYIASQINESVHDKEYWAVVTWEIANTKVQ